MSTTLAPLRRSEQNALRKPPQENIKPDTSPRTTPAGERNKWLISIAVIFGVLMSAIDTSVVNVALPDIQGNVGATQQEITWISTGYMISVVILMPLTHWLSVRFGRKKVYLTSLILFTVSSFLCGTSRGLGELILWRVVQGMGAGTLQPLGQAMFREAFPPQQQGVAMGIFGLVVLSGPAIGPTLGGWITDNYNWPWIFFINIPIGIVGFFFAQSVLRDPPGEHGTKRPPVDAVGIGFLAVGLATLQTVLEQGETDDWFSSTFIVIFTVIAAAALAGFVWWELRTEQPAVDLRILKDVTFASGTLIGGVLGVGLFASLFLLPQYMQTLLGFSATQSGLSLMPRSVTMMLMMPVSGALYNRVGAKPMMIGGLAMCAGAQWVMGHFTLQTGQSDIFGPQVVQGAGFALVFVAMSTATLANIARSQMTSATGLNNLIRQLGGSFGTSIVVTLLTRHTQMARSALVPYASVDNQTFVERVNGMAASFAAHGYGMDTARQMALRLMDSLVTRQAAMVAYEFIFLCIGSLFTLCIPLVFLLRKPARPISTDHIVVGE